MEARNDGILPGGRTSRPEPEDRIGTFDVNTVTREELMRLEGFDGQIANDFVRYRQENGPFKSVDDIAEIPWLSKGQLSRLKEHINLPGIGGGGTR